MVFTPPFHDDTRAETFDVMVARLRSVASEAARRGHVEVPVSSTGEVLVWSRDERPVAFVGLGYDVIRVKFGHRHVDVSGLADRPVDAVLDGVEAAIREGLASVEALGQREPGDVSGDEPSRRAAYDAALAGVSPDQWSSDLLWRLLAERGFGPGVIDMPVVLPAVRAWLHQAAPHTHVTRDDFAVELYDWPGDESTECMYPPESLPPGAWVGVGFDRRPARDTADGKLSLCGGGLQLWYPTDDDWRALFPDLRLIPESIVSFEAFGHGGSCAHWTLSDPVIERIFAMAASKRAVLACRWADDVDEEIPGR